MSKENKLTLTIAVACIAAIGIVFALVVGLAGHKPTGQIAFDGETRRGAEQSFTYNPQKRLKEGQKVCWYVNGQCQKCTTYDGEELTFDYTPTRVGTDKIQVVAGKYTQTVSVEVQKPLLTVTAQNLTVTYGDTPALQFDCDGLLGDDTLDSLGLHIACQMPDCSTCGTKEIAFAETDCENCDYEVIFQTGSLVVLQREIRVANTVSKTYDQTNFVKHPHLELEGVLEGDDVSADVETLFFASRNAGVQQVHGNVVLSGEDSQNYVLCDDMQGEIIPKQLVLEGLTVLDKPYDGTTKAQIAKLGRLRGVIDGDSVAIGSLEVSFANADIGEREIIVEKATLVGMDKDNYVLGDIVVNNATITTICPKIAEK